MHSVVPSRRHGCSPFVRAVTTGFGVDVRAALSTPVGDDFSRAVRVGWTDVSPSRSEPRFSGALPMALSAPASCPAERTASRPMATKKSRRPGCAGSSADTGGDGSCGCGRCRLRAAVPVGLPRAAVPVGLPRAAVPVGSDPMTSPGPVSSRGPSAVRGKPAPNTRHCSIHRSAGRRRPPTGPADQDRSEWWAWTL